jgi:V8-like Glu-specific endopeptidase
LALSSTLLATLGACSGSSSETQILHEGVTYDLLDDSRPVEDAASPEQVRTRAFSTEELARAADLRQRSRSQLALDLRRRWCGRRLVTSHGSPNWAAADSVLAEASESFLQASDDDATGAEGQAVGSISEPIIFGSDNRTTALSVTSHPLRAIARLLLFTGNTFRGQCTGSYIGNRTVITAAHCLVLENGARINRIIFERGRNGSSTLATADCRNDDATNTNNFTAQIPAGHTPALSTWTMR